MDLNKSSRTVLAVAWSCATISESIALMGVLFNDAAQYSMASDFKEAVSLPH